MKSLEIINKLYLILLVVVLSSESVHVLCSLKKPPAVEEVSIPALGDQKDLVYEGEESSGSSSPTTSSATHLSNGGIGHKEHQPGKAHQQGGFLRNEHSKNHPTARNTKSQPTTPPYASASTVLSSHRDSSFNAPVYPSPGEVIMRPQSMVHYEPHLVGLPVVNYVPHWVYFPRTETVLSPEFVPYNPVGSPRHMVSVPSSSAPTPPKPNSRPSRNTRPRPLETSVVENVPNDGSVKKKETENLNVGTYGKTRADGHQSESSGSTSSTTSTTKKDLIISEKKASGVGKSIAPILKEDVSESSSSSPEKSSYLEILTNSKNLKYLEDEKLDGQSKQISSSTTTTTSNSSQENKNQFNNIIKNKERDSNYINNKGKGKGKPKRGSFFDAVKKVAQSHDRIQIQTQIERNKEIQQGKLSSSSITSISREKLVSRTMREKNTTYNIKKSNNKNKNPSTSDIREYMNKYPEDHDARGSEKVTSETVQENVEAEGRKLETQRGEEEGRRKIYQMDNSEEEEQNRGLKRLSESNQKDNVVGQESSTRNHHHLGDDSLALLGRQIEATHASNNPSTSKETDQKIHLNLKQKEEDINGLQPDHQDVKDDGKATLNSDKNYESSHQEEIRNDQMHNNFSPVTRSSRTGDETKNIGASSSEKNEDPKVVTIASEIRNLHYHLDSTDADEAATVDKITAIDQERNLHSYRSKQHKKKKKNIKNSTATKNQFLEDDFTDWESPNSSKSNDLKKEKNQSSEDKLRASVIENMKKLKEKEYEERDKNFSSLIRTSFHPGAEYFKIEQEIYPNIMKNMYHYVNTLEDGKKFAEEIGFSVKNGQNIFDRKILYSKTYEIFQECLAFSKSKEEYLGLPEMSYEIYKKLEFSWYLDPQTFIDLLNLLRDHINSREEVYLRLYTFSKQIHQHTVVENWKLIKEHVRQKGNRLSSYLDSIEEDYQLLKMFPKIQDFPYQITPVYDYPPTLMNNSGTLLDLLVILMGDFEATMRFCIKDKINEYWGSFPKWWTSKSLEDQVKHNGLEPMNVILIYESLGFVDKKSRNKLFNGPTRKKVTNIESDQEKKYSDEDLEVVHNIISKTGPNCKIVPWSNSSSRRWMINTFGIDYQRNLASFCEFFQKNKHKLFQQESGNLIQKGNTVKKLIQSNPNLDILFSDIGLDANILSLVNILRSSSFKLKGNNNNNKKDLNWDLIESYSSIKLNPRQRRMLKLWFIKNFG